MNEDKKTSTADNSGDGSEPKTINIIERAELAGKRLEEQNKRYEENIKRLDELQARQMLGGTTTGPAQAAEKKEISDAEYAKWALKGKVPGK